MSQIPLVLLPGTLCTGLLWLHQIKALGDIAEPVVVDVAQHDDMGAVAQHIFEVMPAPFAVAGLSYGGIIAFELWRQNPAAISHMLLLNTTPLPVTQQKRDYQQHLVQMAHSGNFREVTTDHLKDAMLHPEHQKNMTMRAQVLAMAEEVGVQGFVNQITAQIKRPDSRPTLPTITCPTLVLTGDSDRLCPPHLHQAMAEQIPDATLQIVPNCGHLSAMEQPEAVTAAMRTVLLNQPSLT
jgi:pimeloyl-ACP methyl ester carboxylesterase